MTCTKHGGNDVGSIFCKFCDAEEAADMIQELPLKETQETNEESKQENGDCFVADTSVYLGNVVEAMQEPMAVELEVFYKGYFYYFKLDRREPVVTAEEL